MNIRVLFLIIFISLPFLSKGQYRKNMLFIDDSFEILKKDSNFLTDFNLKNYDDKFYLKFNILNDTVPGYYIVFKSKRFKDIKPVEIIKYENTLIADNISISFYVIDCVDPQYDFYHILKISKKDNFEITDYTIKYISNANIEIDNHIKRDRNSFYHSPNNKNALTDNF